MSTSLRARLSALAACLMLWLTSTGGAYSLSGQQWSSDIVMHLQMSSPTGTLLDGSTSWNQVAENALALWNPFLRDVSFGAVRDSTEGIARSNNVNNVFWGDDVYGDPFGGSVLAVTLGTYRVSDSSFIETDVIFNRGRNWDSYRGDQRNASGGGRLNDLRRVALHEFGHVLGLDHPNQAGQSVNAIMSSTIGNLDSLTTDDTDGAMAIYGEVLLDTLRSGASLTPGQALTSSDGRFRLSYQSDGNLVLYESVDDSAQWNSGTGGTSAGQVTMQSDGNVVMYDAPGTARWSTGTAGNANATLVVQNDGNLVVYASSGQTVWNRNDAAAPAPTPAPAPAPTPTPTPTPAPTPTTTSTSVVGEGSSSLGVLRLLAVPFTTSADGAIGATVDWTFSTNDVDLYLTLGTNPCTAAQFNSSQCPFLDSAESAGAKPEAVSAPDLAAGAYTLYIGNFGPTGESVGFQITLTTSSGAAALAPAAAVAPAPATGAVKGPLQEVITTH